MYIGNVKGTLDAIGETFYELYKPFKKHRVRSCSVIHCVASPFISGEMITDIFRVCKEKGNAITASYSYLLYGSNDGNCAKRTINRESFMTLSAPQSFRYEVVVDFYKQVEEKKLFETFEVHHTALFMAELGIPLYFLQVVIRISR